jgi:hypothetical protein
LHPWLIAQRRQVPDGCGTAKALDYSINRWPALGRKNWLCAGSLRAGQRAAAIMSLLVSAKLNGHDPYAYIKDALTRLPTQKNNQIGELLPHRRMPCPAPCNLLR